VKLTREYVNALTGERVEVLVAELRALVDEANTSAMTLAIAKIEAVKAWHWGHSDDPCGGQSPTNCNKAECGLCGILLCPEHSDTHEWKDGCGACMARGPLDGPR